MKNELLSQFGQRIRQLRKDHGLSQEQLAELTGFHRNYVGMVERGERNLALTNIGIFAKAFNLSIHELLNFQVINRENNETYRRL